MALIEGSNSYGSSAGADAYFTDSIRSDSWSALSTTKKDQGLVEATRILERQSWSGEKEVSSQDLDFPRTGLTDCEGNDVDAADTLIQAQEAQYEYALDLITNPALLNTRDATGSNTKKLEAGSAKITYFRAQSGTRFPLVIQDILGCYFSGSLNNSTSTQGSFASGVCDDSSFDDHDGNFGLTKGFS